MSVVRKMAIAMVKKAQAKIDIKTKRLKADWDEEFLEHILRDFLGKCVRLSCPDPTLAPRPKSLANIPRGLCQQGVSGSPARHSGLRNATMRLWNRVGDVSSGNGK